MKETLYFKQHGNEHNTWKGHFKMHNGQQHESAFKSLEREACFELENMKEIPMQADKHIKVSQLQQLTLCQPRQKLKTEVDECPMGKKKVVIIKKAQINFLSLHEFYEAGN